MAKPLAQHYTISKAIITSDYKTGSGSIDNLDVTAIIAEMNIEETIMRPYTKGQILLADENNILRKYRFTGSERITITLSPAKDNGVPDITRTYIMMGREGVADNAAVVYTLIEECGYLATTKIVSQAYTDTLPSILSSVVKGHLNKDLKGIYDEEATLLDVTKKKTHVVIPQINAWDAINWISNRMSTASGTPYFVSGSLYLNNPVVWSLEKALESRPFNSDAFIHSDVHAKVAGSVELEGSKYSETGISDYKQRFLDSIHWLERNCSMSGIYDIVDTNSNIVSPINYDLANTLKGLVDGNVIKTQAVMDDFFTIDDRQIAYTPSASLMQVTSGGTYLKANSYNDDDTEATTRTKLSNKMLRNVMLSNTVTATISGKLFAVQKATVGRKIRLHFDSADKNEDTKPDLDIKLSGDYIIVGMTHHFSGTEYNVTVEAVKFHDDPKERNV